MLCIHAPVRGNLGQDALHANLSGSLGWGYQACTEGKVFKVGGLQASWAPLLGNAWQQQPLGRPCLLLCQSPW